MSYLNKIKKNLEPQFTFVPVTEGASKKYIHIYVDGSYNVENKIAGWGMIAVDTKVGVISALNGHVSDEKYGSRNITGEIVGAIAGLKWADRRLLDKVIIFHDYIGLGEWAAGNWKTKAPIAIRYKEVLSTIKCKAEFRHVKGHSGNLYNEMVDREAEKGKRGKLFKI